MRHTIMTVAVLTVAATSYAQGAHVPKVFDTCGTMVNIAFEMQAPRQCEIPNYPTPSNIQSLGLRWCRSDVDFQQRVFALRAAGIWCDVLDGRLSRSEAREPLRTLCESLELMAVRFGYSGCQCPRGYIP